MEHMNSMQVNTTCYYDTIWSKIYMQMYASTYVIYIYMYTANEYGGIWT